MKKFISVILMAALALSLFAACGKTETQTPNAPKGNDLSGETLTAIVDKIYEKKMPEFPVGPMELDLADGETLMYMAGISDASLVKEVLVSEAMMGSQAYSMVLARVNDAAKAEEVANMMLENINPRKWICVGADDIDAAIYGDLVLFVMIDSQYGIPAADFIGEFKTIAGGALDKELSK
ncbi:MAG: hypothetical protein IKU58_03670 [Clostridia bacterium]|nr:hypothetical protein [Clostridia bacterium]